jgi:hypothetical protein
MGARINYIFKTEENKPNIVLYSHWGETEWRDELSLALEKAQRRLDMGDISYATRIAISYLIGNQWADETGFGIYIGDDETTYWDFSVEVDMVNQMVNDNGNWHSFSSFIEYQKEVHEYHAGV